MNRSVVAALALLLVAVGTPLPAATDNPGGPVSFRTDGLSPLSAVALWESPRVDVARLLEEDAAGRHLPGAPLRVGHPLKADLSPATDGTWENLPGGSRIWRLRVRSADALWIGLGFGTYGLTGGAVLHAYGDGKGPVQGPFTSADVRDHGQLWLAPIEGDTAVIELFWPAKLRGVRPELRLGTVSHGYKAWDGFGHAGVRRVPRPDERILGSGSCNIDVNCPLGDDWQDEKRGVVRMFISGSFLCTGSLINNTANDCTDYLLTAAHCYSGGGTPAGTVFFFNYERSGCGTGSASLAQAVSGSTLVSSLASTDFTLLELSSAPPPEYGAFYNGWSRAAQAASQSWAIHHPGGDVKKISHNDDALLNGSNWPNHWRVDNWESGTTEGGSSGCPLFDQDHRIVGQLHGGTASCSSLTWDEFGKFDASWTGGGSSTSRLSDWLDPLRTDQPTLDGIDAAFCAGPGQGVAYAGHLTDDAQGNGSGAPDPGETFVLEVDLGNNGTTSVSRVTSVLSTTTPNVAVDDYKALWGTVAAATTRSSAAPHFTLSLDPGFVCGDPVDLRLDIRTAEEPRFWSDTFSLPTGTATVVGIFSDDMESGTNGWTAATPVGSNDWVQTNAASSSPTTSWFVADIATTGDSTLTMPTLSGLASGATLRFKHWMSSEAGFDGGVLEYRRDGGTWFDAGSFIRSGGYNSTIDTGFGSPIAGRQAWSGGVGSAGAFSDVEVDLSGLAGSDVQLRWRFATDDSVSALGWYVDDVVVDQTTFGCDPLPAPQRGRAGRPAVGQR